MTTSPARLPIADTRGMLAAARELSRGHRGALAGTLILFAAASALSLVFPLTIGWIVDTVSAHVDTGVPPEFWGQLTLLGAAVIFAGVIDIAAFLSLSRTMETMISALREMYVDRALHLPQATVEEVGTGDIIARVSSDIREIANTVPFVIPRLIGVVFTFALAVGGLAVIDWRFAIVLVAVLPLYLLALRWYLRTGPVVYAASRSAESTRSQHLLDTIHALPTVSAYRLEESRRSLTRAATWELVRWAVRARIVQNKLFGRINIVEGVGLVLLLGVGFFLAATGPITVGQITAAGLLYFQVIGPVSELLFVMDDLQSAAASLGRIVGVTERPPQKPDAEVSAAAPISQGDASTSGTVVDLTGVGFGYRTTRPVLTEIDFSLDTGEHVALVGTSGSGKTTLARLVSGTYAPDTGRLAHGIEHHRIAYLNQEHHIFAGTLRDNLSLTTEQPDDPALLAALALVRAEHILHDLPDGLDSRVGHHGHGLTPTDAQHLALARLVLHDPALAILDEATAESDSQNIALLDDATEAAIRGRSAIVIAHRLSQAVACDRIVVLERGRIVEEGSHAELLARGDRYATLWQAWSAGRDAESAPPNPPRT